MPEKISWIALGLSIITLVIMATVTTPESRKALQDHYNLKLEGQK